jgi:PAS domain-containing protein
MLDSETQQGTAESGSPHTPCVGLCRQGDLKALMEARIAELSQSQHRLSLIPDTVQAGFLVIDAETHVISEVNPAAAKMIGRLPAEIVGRVCHRFICPAEKGHCPITDLGQTSPS